MKVPRARLSAVVVDRLAAGEPAETVAREMAAYLLSENRAQELDSLLRDIQQYRADHGIVEAEAISAFPLTAEARAEVEQKVRDAYPKAKQIIITERRDDSVLGGVKLRLAQEQLDLTVRNQLNRFKQLTAVGD